MKSVHEIGDLKGKKVLVRVDWNVPVENGEVRDDSRIKRSFPTLQFLLDAGASVTICTHLEPEDLSTQILQKFVPKGATLMENLRKNPGEKANDIKFAEELSKGFDIFVNEAFSASHREHASIVSVPKLLPSYAGLEFMEEVENLSKVFDPPHPFFFVLGGAKFETKLPLVKKFLNLADSILIAGGNGKPAFDQGFGKYEKVMFPHGDISAPDSDSQTLEMCKEKIDGAKLVVWNGPLGKYELGYKEGTEKLAEMIANSNAKSIVGGADTLATIKELNIFDKFTFVSAGGGATLDFLANETLPGIEALN